MFKIVLDNEEAFEEVTGAYRRYSPDEPLSGIALLLRFQLVDFRGPSSLI